MSCNCIVYNLKCWLGNLTSHALVTKFVSSKFTSLVSRRNAPSAAATVPRSSESGAVHYQATSTEIGKAQPEDTSPRGRRTVNFRTATREESQAIPQHCVKLSEANKLQKDKDCSIIHIRSRTIPQDVNMTFPCVNLL